jgi:tetratricopeptide (TPR) repeat protein
VVRRLAEQGMWILWSRSGDAAVDALMAKGARELEARDLAAAIATYSEVIRRKPSFAEGWNKRATAYFLNDDLKRSLADCDEVMKRNPYHFGALSGYGQIHFQQKQYDKAIEYWQRALKVNPNLGLADNIEMARRMLAQSGKSST